VLNCPADRRLTRCPSRGDYASHVRKPRCASWPMNYAYRFARGGMSREPTTATSKPGTWNCRFRSSARSTAAGLDAVIEVRSKYFESRAKNRQVRTDMLHDTSPR